MSVVLEVRDVTKTFGSVRAVDGVSFTVRRGTITGLLGRNGAGKTTTIRMITGIFFPDSGTIELLGGKSGDPRDHIGYLPEERGLYRQMKVVELLGFLAEIKGRRGADVQRDIARWLDRFELGEKRDSKVEELSKGNQQKVQLIGTVLHKPDLLILDEPFSGLDPLNQELFRELLLEYRQQGKGVILSTHGMELAERLCDSICLISQGRAILTGELRAIKRRLGGNSYRLVGDKDIEEGLDRLRALPEVEQAVVQDGVAKLLLRPDADGADVLRRIVGFLRVHELRSEEPELEQIFLKAVRDAA